MLPIVNQVLYMQVASMDEEESNEVHKSRIAEVRPEYIAMEIPINVKTGKLKRLYEGDEISAHFINKSGTKFFFNTHVIGFKQENIRLAVIRTPEADTITQAQRRSFLRVAAGLEISVQVSDEYRFLAVTDDVGGGGTSFVCGDHIKMKVKDELNCWLLLQYKSGEVDHVPFKGEIVRIKPLESGRQLLMVSFSEIYESDRQKIIRYCFERQLEFRKR